MCTIVLPNAVLGTGMSVHICVECAVLGTAVMCNGAIARVSFSEPACSQCPPVLLTKELS